MKVITQDFTVRYRFPVIFTRGAFRKDNGTLAEVLRGSGAGISRVLTVVDSGVVGAIPGLPDQMAAYGRRHGELIAWAGPPCVVSGGESCKGDATEVARIHALIERGHLCRHSFVLAIGGGAVLDAAGYAAATAHRGIRLIRMPSTTLAQNDSGVGVKNGINGFGRKNFIGTFTPPFAVISDFDFIDALPERDKRAGIAEAVKVALVRDRVFFDELFRNRRRLARLEPTAMEGMIVRSAELHLEHIGTGGDPFEQGSARPLDFGHWSAHRLEELTGGEVRHGEAVAIGVALDSLYAYRSGRLAELELARILSTLEEIGFELYHGALDWLDVGEALKAFREHLGGELTLTLPAGIGRGMEAHRIDVDLMRGCVDELKQRYQNKVLKKKEKGDVHSMPSEVRRPDAGSLLHREPRQAPRHRILS